jgi:hypothetical protein
LRAIRPELGEHSRKVHNGSAEAAAAEFGPRRYLGVESDAGNIDVRPPIDHAKVNRLGRTRKGNFERLADVARNTVRTGKVVARSRWYDPEDHGRLSQSRCRFLDRAIATKDE